MQRRTLSRWLLPLFFIVVLAVGFVTVPQYGRPWDERLEMDILRMNLWEYARAVGAEESAFAFWQEQGNGTTSELLPISESIERDHGAAAFYPLAGVVMDATITEHSRMLLWHLWCWALFTLGALALYGCCRELELSRAVGMAAVCFLLLSPRFFAEGHYNNKDTVLMALTLCVLWTALRLMARPGVWRGLLFALAGAFCANMKVIGFALWGLCALFVLLRQLLRHNGGRRVWAAGLAAFFGFIGFYALLTPALWREPLAFFRYLVENALDFSRWKNYVRFRGQTYLLGKDRLPRIYLPYMIAATTPLWVLFLCAAGQLGTLKSWKKGIGRSDRALGLLLCTLLWLLPLGAAVAAGATVYNGWRHFYFLYGPMLVLAAYGLHGLYRLMAGKRMARRLLTVLLSLCMALTGVGIVTQHPYQYAYEQPLVRLLTGQDDLERDYWNVSVLNALETLAGQTDGEIVIAPADLWAQAGLESALYVMEPGLRERFSVAEEPDGAEYVLSNPTYTLFSGWEPSEEQEEAVVIRAYGRTLMRIDRHR